MNNKEKYDRAFIESLSVERSLLGDKLLYNTVPEWDSVGHMALVAALEETFGITMETDDIIALSSYKKGMELLGKYGVEF